MYENRRTIVDLRLGKNFELGATTLNVYVDLYNAFNNHGIVFRNNTLGPQWGLPLSIVNGRLAQFGGRWSF